VISIDVIPVMDIGEWGIQNLEKESAKGSSEQFIVRPKDSRCPDRKDPITTSMLIILGEL
jgi:hypothetical protein